MSRAQPPSPNAAPQPTALPTIRALPRVRAIESGPVRELPQLIVGPQGSTANSGNGATVHYGPAPELPTAGPRYLPPKQYELQPVRNANAPMVAAQPPTMPSPPVTQASSAATPPRYSSPSSVVTPAVFQQSVPPSSSPTQAIAPPTNAPPLPQQPPANYAPPMLTQPEPVPPPMAPPSQGPPPPTPAPAPNIAPTPTESPPVTRPPQPQRYVIERATGDLLSGPQVEVLPATGKLSFKFQNAPWDLVLKQFATEAGLSLQVETLPEGTFTYIDQRAHTPSEAIDIINGSLMMNGHLLVRRSGKLTLTKLQDGVPFSELPLIALHDLQQWGKNELLSVDVPLATVDPLVAAQELQPLLSPMGRVTPLPQTHRMIVTDLGGNLRRLYHLLWIGEADPGRLPHVVFHLKNIQAVDAAKAINDFLTSQKQTTAPPLARAALANQAGQAPLPLPVPSDTTIVAEATTNCVIVSATNRHLERIRMLLHELDTIPVQVVIQALLVEVDLGKNEEAGVELGGQDSVLFDRSVVDNLVTVTQTVSNPATGIATTNQQIVSQTAAPGFNFNNQPLGNNIAANPSRTGTQGLSNFAVGRVNGDLGYGGLVLSAGSSSVNVLLRALAATRKIDILSRPQIRTIDNRPAEIQIGQQVPVVDGVALTPVGSANPVIRQDQAGIILRVVPRVNPHGEVVIDVTAEKSEFRLGKGTGVPIFTDATNGNVIEAPIKDVSKAKATVSCPNGQTIVLGGMITKGTSVMERKVPWLGDVPLLGRLFRYDSETMARKELLIFLTPQVISCPTDSEAQKEVEVARTHFPVQDAMQLHSQQPGPLEPIQPPGPRFPRAERRETRTQMRGGTFVN